MAGQIVSHYIGGAQILKHSVEHSEGAILPGGDAAKEGNSAHP